jgi:diguanylate cyclase (GGDEF)-like protein
LDGCHPAALKPGAFTADERGMGPLSPERTAPAEGSDHATSAEVRLALEFGAIAYLLAALGAAIVVLWTPEQMHSTPVGVAGGLSSGLTALGLWVYRRRIGPRLALVVLSAGGLVGGPVACLNGGGLGGPYALFFVTVPVTVAIFSSRATTLIVAGACSIAAIVGSFGLPHDNLAPVRLLFITALSIGSGLIIQQSHADRRAAERRLHRLAALDGLTGALTRRAFEEAAAARLTSPACGGSLVFFDLDHFKRVNDVHGHEAGDRALQLFVEAARRELRADDLLGRLGGDEFVVFLPGSCLDEAHGVGARVVARLAREVEGDRELAGLSASFGATAWSDDAPDLAAAVRAADLELLDVKRARAAV